MIFHQALVDCARAAILLPLGIFHPQPSTTRYFTGVAPGSFEADPRLSARLQSFTGRSHEHTDYARRSSIAALLCVFSHSEGCFFPMYAARSVC